MKPIFALLLACLMTTSAFAALPTPPQAEKRPHTVTAPHGAARADEYYWLRDDTRSDPQVLAYLEAENAYADALLAPLQPLEEQLYQEMIGRIHHDDSSVAWRQRGWWYYTRFESGKDYPIYARRRDQPGIDATTIEQANRNNVFDDEQRMLDVNQLAEGQAYYQVANWAVSPDNRLLAWAEDVTGRRQYRLRFLDLETHQFLPDHIDGASADIIWADDNRSVFYIENDPDTLLGVRVKRHILGTTSPEDTLVYAEGDSSFYISLSRSRDERYLLINLHSTVSAEVRYAPVDNPQAFTVLAPRQADVEYEADHFNGRWVIRTNSDGARNFKLVTAPDGSNSSAQWQDWIAHDPQVLLEGYELFAGYTVVMQRSQALEQLYVVLDDGRTQPLAMDEPVYALGLEANPEPDSPWLRYRYTSLTTPATIYEWNVITGERRLLKQQAVIGYNPAHYQTQRIWVTARDGARIPVSLVYKQGLPRNGQAALYLYAYGSYGISMPLSFNPSVISLLDRNVVYAIAHIRGGEEMGRAWYEAGKLLNKQNTFNDFIDVTRALVEQGYAAADRVAAAGGSAGGLLMGAVANQAPQHYQVMLAQVPFVDVVTTMLDASIPLTTNEYDEWGNPEQPEFYDYMLGYSPYDNVRPQAYPALYVGAGLWDSQVQYWEPAKWVARLRANHTGAQPIVLRTNMDAGHGGKSGRFRRFRETAQAWAFVLTQLGAEARQDEALENAGAH